MVATQIFFEFWEDEPRRFCWPRKDVPLEVGKRLVRQKTNPQTPRYKVPYFRKDGKSIGL